ARRADGDEIPRRAVRCRRGECWKWLPKRDGRRFGRGQHGRRV
ncbi:MAG: hypothetical protein AVDCRST_MAG04-3156, partial [uncultured Acetobacteraceae bacterium]